jgi:phosphate transport system substrate-binding protein
LEPGASPLVLAISNDPLGIGYAGVLFQELTTVKILAIAERAGEPFVKPSAETVRQGIYPMGRKLFLYANKAPNQELTPLVREFLEFANSREGQEMVVQSGFYPLSISEVTSNLALLAGRLKSKSK